MLQILVRMLPDNGSQSAEASQQFRIRADFQKVLLSARRLVLKGLYAVRKSS